MKPFSSGHGFLAFLPHSCVSLDNCLTENITFSHSADKDLIVSLSAYKTAFQ